MSGKALPHTIFTEFDIYLFKTGQHHQLYNKLGNRQIELNGSKGTYFAVYAPAARSVQVIGNFNNWEGANYDLFVRWDGSGIWEGFIPGIDRGEMYKYKIYSHYDSKVREKSDPYGFYFEMAPGTACITWDTWFEWDDGEWMKKRKDFNAYDSPISIYEVHLGSWKKQLSELRSLHYSELAEELVDYVVKMGFTHVELLPVTEHPFYPSWGYLSTGFFAPTSRFGAPQELMSLIQAFHKAGIGVILDWVPAHFPADDSWLADFDGSHVYEHPNPKKGYHPDWNSLIFNFERPEIQSFLLSSAHFWLDRYHIDGLRVDAVASMLYLDYSRNEGEWDPNEYGGNENFPAIGFLKNLNQSTYERFPGIMMMAEESTAFQGITRPVYQGGLGFGFKWMMGWMNDTLRYLERNPIYRKYHHNEISFSMAYAYSETYILPLSHDEVVHGKRSLVYKMPGDDWQRFANLRLLYSYMFSHPGHKLLFMGNEIGQTSEWNVDGSVEWHLLDHDPHKGIWQLILDLNALFTSEPALYQYSFVYKGFQWIDHGDHENSILAYVRHSEKEMILVVCNFTPSVHDDYRLGIPEEGTWKEIFNSNSTKFWGTGEHHNGKVLTDKIESHGFDQSLSLEIPPLGVIYLKKKKKRNAKK